ncbi:MAG: sigma 54-interacting transcriptional regulator [Polyangiaceae bacterium]
MSSRFPSLFQRLAKAESFESAAEAALCASIEIARAAVEASTFAGRARVLRAMVHHRPDDGYRRLVVVEVSAQGETAHPKVGESEHLPSATAWRWVRTNDSSVAIDLTLGKVTLASGASSREAKGAGSFNAQASAARLLARDATHLFVVPLRAPLGRIEGMLVIEASARSAIGDPFVWDGCKDELETVAGLAAQYLSRLPIMEAGATATDEFLPVIGSSMQGVVEMLRVFARQEETVLLSGPTGAGKSRLARWCHERSAQRGSPFETLELSAIPEDLQLAQLFGWKRGAFTSAVKDNPGHITRADGGTLFIDEIDKLSLASQAGLLRVLEEKRYRQIGDSEGDRIAQVRFIIGTNADLGRLAEEGKFRTDLYYRINVLPVRIPALRERSDEIGDWARFMLRRRHGSAGGEATITPDAIKLLAAHDWPGNLRQLDNIVRRAYALSQIDQEAEGVVVLRAEHVERALRYEGSVPLAGLLEHMKRVAEMFVSEAENRFSAETPLDLDLCDAFKGLVLDAAAARWPDDKDAVKKAFILLGKEPVVKSRNHWAHHEREMKVVEKLRAALDVAPLTPPKPSV